MTINEWLNNDQLGIDIWTKKYCYNNESFDQWLERVSQGDSEVKNLIINKKFLFGGRTLSNRGVSDGSSLSNCYSSGYLKDSLEDIMQVNKNIALTYKAQGGQGLSLSKIRPKGALINNRYKSDGIVPFMELFNQTTASISQGGSRKGALLMSLDAMHPQILDFITIKEDKTKILNANLSVELSDEFMQAVVDNKKLKVNNFGLTYEVDAPFIFTKICESAIRSAEPGVLFTNRLRNYNIMQHVESYNIETTNPCGEQPLCKNGACCLSSINVSAYVKNPFTNNSWFDFKELAADIPVITLAMDDVLEEGMRKHPLPEQREVARKFRNIGIGIMGLADALIKLGMTYGSNDAVRFAKRLQNFIFNEALMASVNLGLDRGSFPGYTKEVWDSDIIRRNVDGEKITYFKKTNRLRNCSLLSVAPTGSIGTMIGVSTGAEVNFALEFNRTTKSLNNEEKVYKVQAGIVNEYRKVHPKGELPSYFVTAQDISWKDKIAMQAALQDATDTGISTTINLKSTITLEEVKKLYIKSWSEGLKGQTIYVEGSRDPILSINKEKEQKLSDIKELKRGEIERPSDDYLGLKRTIMTGCGTLHVNVYVDKATKQLKEIYLSKGSTGGCSSFMSGLSRMVSLAARGGISTEAILDQLISCGTCPSYAVRRATKKDTSPGACCPSAIANAIKDIMAQANKEEVVIKNPQIDLTYIKNELELGFCPECKTKGIVAQGGCSQCQNCGWSKCS